MPANDDLGLLIAAAEAAGRLALPYWKAAPEAWDKGGGAGPVTEADLAVDRMLRAELLAARPDYGWLSEESPDTPARLDATRVFIVDPIDGTRAFIAGDGNWAHSIAVAEHGQIVAAVVFLPARDRLYSAALGEGACFNGARMVLSERHDPDGATILTAHANLRPEHWPGGMPTLVHKFRPSLAYRMALVAQGRYDAMLTLRNTWEWDVAAGTLLVTEAGGLVTDRHGHPPAFNRDMPAIKGLIAAATPMAQALATRLRPIR